jgi:release factor glutamine methyltransferase
VTALRAAVREAAGRLAAAGVASPEHDARALAVHVLGLARPADLLLLDTLDPTQGTALDELVARRAERVPLQHLTGVAGFRRLTLRVGRGVFVPRPETESVVQWALDAVQRSPGREPVCVDLCAGSGAIALSLAAELPAATVHAVEQDAQAMTWLRRNAADRAAAGDRPVHLHTGGVEEALPELDARVDLVISNPPYVSRDELRLAEPEVLEHDPRVALEAGEDGLDVIRQVERTARRLLRPGGLVVVEHSDRQGVTAPEVFAATGAWAEVTDHRDDTGRDRYLTARRT